MLPLEWLAFLIPLATCLLKVVLDGKEAKLGVIFIILVALVGTVVSIFFGFIDAFLLQTTFTLTKTELITYLLASIIGTVITPLARYLALIKLE